MKPKVYLYPITVKKNKNDKGVYNPYKDNFMLSMGEHLEFVYNEKPSSAGILNVLKFDSQA